MKNVTFFLASFILIFSCQKDKLTPENKTASLSLNIGVNIVEMDAYKITKSTSAVGDYKVEIYNSEGEIVEEYQPASDMPEVIELVAGTYTVIAHSDNLTSAAFDTPYYYGELEITLIEGESKTETVTCTMANCAVRIVYSQDIVDGFDTHSTVVTNDDGGSLTYDEDETRPGYFSLSPIHIVATLTNSSETKTLTADITNPEAAIVYEVQLNASASEETGLSINLVEDGTTTTQIILVGEDATTGREPAAGELIISEIMANPEALGDSEGEYIEIYNASSDAININGLIVRDGSSDFTVSQDVIIQSHDYATIAKTDAVTFVPDYVSSSLGLTNSGEALALFFVINTVETELSSLNFSNADFPTVQSGASMELSTNHLNAADAASGVNWCTAVSEMSAGGDLGTPGAANDCN